MLPSEIVEEIFAYLSRDALDHCQIICLKWSKLIESSKRLSQRRIVSLDYNNYYDSWNEPFYVELKSSTGKTIRIEDDILKCEYKIHTTSPESSTGRTVSPVFSTGRTVSPVFKNVIIDELVVHNKNVFNLHLWRIFESAGFRIIVKRVFLEITRRIEGSNIEEMLEHFHHSLTEYIDADEITMKIIYLPEYEDDEDVEDEVLFNKESWEYFDFGKKTEFNLHYHSIISPNDFSDDIFKEFISGKYNISKFGKIQHMEHSKLNELEIYFDEIEYDVVTPLIVEAFCDTDEPHEFFKSIKTLRINYFDKIDGEFGFVRDDRDPQKYRLSHPKLNWALEATQPPDELLKFQLIEL